MSDNPRAFIDMNGGYQSTMTGPDKEAHDAWVQSNTWNLTRDDFIRLSYFHGDLDVGSNGLGPCNGSEDRPGDVVYISGETALTRSMVSYWLNDSNSFMHGYKKALAAQTSPAKPDLSGMTDERILEIRDSIKTGDGWDGDQWDIALSRALLAAITKEQL